MRRKGIVTELLIKVYMNALAEGVRIIKIMRMIKALQ
jgi:hypothetical protein